MRARIDKLLSVNGSRTVDSFHKELGRVMGFCGMEREREACARRSLGSELKKEYWSDVKVLGTTMSSIRRSSGPVEWQISSSSVS